MSVSGLPLQLTIPSDERFRSIALAMARRVAESVGFAGAEVSSLREELARGAADATREARGGAEALVVDFEIAGSSLRVRCRCGTARVEVLRTLPGA